MREALYQCVGSDTPGADMYNILQQWCPIISVQLPSLMCDCLMSRLSLAGGTSTPGPWPSSPSIATCEECRQGDGRSDEIVHDL